MKNINKILVCLMAILLITGCGSKSKKTKKDPNLEDLKVDVNFNVTDDKEIEGLYISNVSFIIENGVSTYTAKVKNNTGDIYKLEQINLIYKDKKGKEIGKMSSYIGDSIPVDGTRYIEVSSEKNLKEAASIEYEIEK